MSPNQPALTKATFTKWCENENKALCLWAQPSCICHVIWSQVLQSLHSPSVTLKEISVVMVKPWVMTGSSSVVRPFQQSSSMQRHPDRRTCLYISTEEFPASWPAAHTNTTSGRCCTDLQSTRTPPKACAPMFEGLINSHLVQKIVGGSAYPTVPSSETISSAHSQHAVLRSHFRCHQSFPPNFFLWTSILSLIRETPLSLNWSLCSTQLSFMIYQWGDNPSASAGWRVAVRLIILGSSGRLRNKKISWTGPHSALFHHSNDITMFHFQSYRKKNSVQCFSFLPVVDYEHHLL